MRQWSCFLHPSLAAPHAASLAASFAASLPPLLACRHLLTLINDIMDYSKLVAGQLELHHERIHVETLLQVAPTPPIAAAAVTAAAAAATYSLKN